MKTLFIAPFPPPVTGQSVAAEVFYQHHGKRADISVINTSREIVKKGWATFSRAKEVFGMIFKVARMSRSSDVIYFNVSQSISGNLKDILIYLMCLGRLDRVVIHLHGGAGMRVLLSDKHPILKRLNAIFLRRLGAVIVLGDRLKDIYSDIVPDSKLFSVPNFSKDEYFVSEFDVERKFSSPKKLKLLFLSNLLNGKGHEELLSSIALLSIDERTGIEVDFAGGFESQEAERSFKVRAASISGAKITVHGIVQGELKKKLLSEAHIFCLPTYYPYEGQPISILEAYASGCVVVTTNHSGIFDTFTPGHNGYEVEKKSSASIAAAIREIFKNKDELINVAKNNISDAVAKYRTSSHIASLESILAGVAGDSTLGSAIRANESDGNYLAYKICKHCIMDTSDPSITFDEKGWCDYCNNFESHIKPSWHTDKRGEAALEQLARTIKSEGVGREFDCIIGLSGGLDSSYAAYVAKEKMGLRPLLLHVDAGWNTDQAVGNIEKLVDGLGLDLYTEVVNWDEVRRLQVAFLRSGIPDQDLVQDAAFFSGIYRFARQHGIKHIITGSNFSTECCREPEEWGGYLGIDKRLFGDIWAQFGEGRLDSFPLVDIFVYKAWYQKVLGMKIHYPLNMVPYIKQDAEEELGRLYGWQRFKHKHHESRFTRFYEDYWLPRRFGYEKRRAHFSSLIMTGQMTRDDALERIAHPEMDEHFLTQEFEFVAHKLGLTVSELQNIFDAPLRTYRHYKNKRWLIGLGANAMRTLGIEKRYFR